MGSSGGLSGEAGGGAPGLLGVLTKHADFRRLFVGSSVSLLGSSVTTVALPLTGVVHLGASAVEMGVLSAVALLPHLVLGLPAGVWVGRLPYRRVLVVTDLAQMLVLGVIPALAVLGVLRMWHLYVVAVATGAAGLLSAVAAQSFTPELVPRDRLLAANSGLMLSNATVGTTGAAVGGMLVTVLTAPVAIVVDATSFLVSAVVKSRIRVAGRVSAAARPGRLGPEVVEGWRAVFGHPVMRPVVVAATIGAFAGQFKAVVLVLYLVRDLGLSPGQVGLLVALSGVAAVAGAVAAPSVTRRLGPGPAFVAGMLVESLSGAVLAAASGPVLVTVAVLVAAQVMAGAGPSVYGVNQQTFRQTFFPPELLPRVNATWRFLAFGGQSVGALAAGLTAAALEFRPGLLIGTCLAIAGTAVAFGSPIRTVRGLPGGSSARTASGFEPAETEEQERQDGEEDPAGQAGDAGEHRVRHGVGVAEEQEGRGHGVESAVADDGRPDAFRAEAQPAEDQAGEHAEAREVERGPRAEGRVVVAEQGQRAVPQAPDDAGRHQRGAAAVTVDESGEQPAAPAPFLAEGRDGVEHGPGQHGGGELRRRHDAQVGGGSDACLAQGLTEQAEAGEVQAQQPEGHADPHGDRDQYRSADPDGGRERHRTSPPRPEAEARPPGPFLGGNPVPQPDRGHTE
ncbi:hypothetical protein GCM10009677_14730 [Sphaerisporangium rubeum]